MALIIRGLRVGDGVPLARLWRELWLLHESWGGYATAEEDEVFVALTKRLEDDGDARNGTPLVGRHVHLVAEDSGLVVGQVEGWLEHFGSHIKTLPTCEIRSLIVSESHRRHAVGQKLLNALERVSIEFFRSRCVLAAEVLERNPARGFYERLGFEPGSWTLAGTPAGSREPVLGVRHARPGDELAIAKFESWLAMRRRQSGDVRFDPPAPIDASWLAAIRGVLSVENAESDRATFVATNASGTVTGTAQFLTHALDPPFARNWRAVLSRLVVSEAESDRDGVQLLFQSGQRAAHRRRAARLEVTDCPGPGSWLHDRLLEAGAEPWSRIVLRLSAPR